MKLNHLQCLSEQYLVEYDTVEEATKYHESRRTGKRSSEDAGRGTR